MFRLAGLLFLSCGFACAEPLEVFGVRLGEKPNLPECAISNGNTFLPLPPESVDVCVSATNINEKQVLFSIGACPKYTHSCSFYVTVNEADEAVGFWIPTGGGGSTQEAKKALIRKFGKPSSVSVVPMQNSMGAGFMNHILQWKKPGYKVKFIQFWGSTSEGKISIETPNSLQIEKLKNKLPAQM